MQRDPRVYIWDARNSADLIAKFTSGKTRADYENDEFLRSAVERQFEIVGEALNQLARTSPDLAQHIPDLRAIVGFRNVLAHGYSTVNHATVWEILQNNLPPLREALAHLLEET